LTAFTGTGVALGFEVVITASIELELVRRVGPTTNGHKIHTNPK